ncbi:MAG: carboxypeptidase-like regulatory domain-containing protein, partial [Bacteroidetes bacterium]|nr:carboxypeptidase-like regulatory domain-containing protein [Bacteroidota bacterium]
MKNLKQLMLLLLLIVYTSTMVFAQNQQARVKPLSKAELEMMQKIPQVSVDPNYQAPDNLLAVPVTSFPYFANFESGSMPAEFDAVAGIDAHVRIDADAAYSSSWGLLFDGNTSTNYGSTPTTYAMAFDPSKATHFGTVYIDVIPSGAGGVLKMQFMLRQGYSFSTDYCWFRVLVNGNLTPDEGGGPGYYQAVNPVNYLGEWVERTYDLSAYQGGGQFEVTLQSSCKYYELYYQQGDIVHIDDFQIWYSADPGDIEGYVLNGDGLTIAGATVGIEGFGITTSGPSGYYFLATVPGGDQTVFAWKQGYNQVFETVNVPPLGIAYQDMILTQPTMFISPTYHDVTLNPNEYYTTNTGILNTGDGLLEWFAEVVYPTTDGPDNTDDYCAGSGGCDEYIARVQIGTIDNSSTCTQYGDYTYLSTEVAPGESYAITVTNGNPIWTADECGIWVDWNQNEDFTDDGSITVSGSPGVGPYTATITVPDDAIPGLTRMRIRIDYANTPQPCGSTSFGEVEDYSLEVMGGAYGWLTLDYYTGTVPPNGGLVNVPTHFDATGASAGEVYHADIVFTSNPDVATITIPCTMTILGPPLTPPEDLEVTLVNDITGQVNLTWTWAGDAFQFFIVRRDGTVVGSTTNQYFTDFLPDYAEYCYTVQAVYDEGQTAPAGPECVLWPDPDILIDPDTLEGYVWVGQTVDVNTWVYNNGLGTLQYTFPEYVTLALLNDPKIEKNQPGSPMDNSTIIDEKTTIDPYSGSGYPVVLGAGGPDPFGYVWIDSDETGGPAFDWIEISGTGTLVTGLSDDNVVGPYNIGFDFPFYDVDKTQFWINSNGTIGFTNTYITLTNYSIPTGNSYVDFIAWYWDDLDPGNPNTHVYYQNINGRLVIQFDTYYEYPDGNRYVDAQMQLFPSGKILILYDYIDPGFDVAGGTVGIQSADNSLGLQVAYNTAYIHNDLALMFSLPSDFVVDVQPPTGFVPEGGAQELTLTYDAQDYAPGTYTQDILCESNDPDIPEVWVHNIMHVYMPGQIAGTVTDGVTGLGISGATVTAMSMTNSYQTITDPDGEYSMYLDEAVYDVTFSKLGYQTVIVEDTFALAGIVTPIDVEMYEEPYPPAWVLATVNDPDTECLVEWSLPVGPYEILYDDGSADELVVWATSGNENAVKFTPLGYPATAVGGRLYVGDGTFPDGNWFGTEFAIKVYDDDGQNGLPGTLLDSIGVIVDNFGWIEFWGLNSTIENGNFYISMEQLTYAPDAAPLGVDYTTPTVNRSYSRHGSGDWGLSVYQDFMIRAYVEGPATDGFIADGAEMMRPPKLPQGIMGKHFFAMNGTTPLGIPGVELGGDIRPVTTGVAANRDVVDYDVARVSDFDPNAGPQTGTLTILTSTGNLSYNDVAYGGLAQGWYAYAVRANYTNGDVSDWVYSNIVGHLMDFEVTFEITLSTGDVPEDVELTLAGEDYPYNTYFGVTDATGIFTFDSVMMGNYAISVYKIAFETYAFLDNIQEDKYYVIQLCEKRYPPRNLWVDPLTSWAYWDMPIVEALWEEFEDATFPPLGWQSFTNSVGWFRTDDGSSSSWPIPTWDSYYACSNDDAAGSDADGSMDYLITPPL